MSTGIAKKVVLIGLESCNPRFFRKFMDAGRMPNAKRLADQGVFAEILGVMPNHPTTGWTSIATGAYPGTHGNTCNATHLPGEPLLEQHSSFFSSFTTADFLWDAAERAGKKVILVRYPCSWPPTISQGIQVGGYESHGTDIFQVADAVLFTTEETSDLPKLRRIELKPADGWAYPEGQSSGALEATLVIQPEQGEVDPYVCSPLKVTTSRFLRQRWNSEPVVFEILIVKSGDGYDRILFFKDKKGSAPVAEARTGGSTRWIETECRAEEGTRIATHRFTVNILAKDGGRLDILSSEFTQTDGWTIPAPLARELLDAVGPYQKAMMHDLRPPEPGQRTPFVMRQPSAWLPETACQTEWLANACAHLLRNYECDLLCTTYGRIDEIQHAVWPYIDPLCTQSYDEKKAPEYWQALGEAFAQIDRMIGKIADAAGPGTAVMAVSTHGQTSPAKRINLENALAKAGLLSFEVDPTTAMVSVDWRHTKALVSRAIHVYVNLKGREPHGIVESGEEYEQVREQVIDILYGLKDPDTGRHIVTTALRKEDAVSLGLFGDAVGDVVFTFLGGYQLFAHFQMGESGAPTNDLQVFNAVPEIGTHGWSLPSAEYGLGTLKAVFLASGAGITRGSELPLPIKTVDIAPTISHLLDFPVPKHASGRVLYEVLS